MKKKASHFANYLLDNLTRFSLVLFACFKRKLNIIQIGANDGKSIDHLHSLIRKKKSTAIVVEPVPHVFQLLKRTYASYPNVIPRQLAITDREDELHKTFYYFSPKQGVDYQEGYSLWGSFSLDHIQKFKVPHFEKLLVAEELPCTTVNALIQESKFASIQILATDTEGFDGKIIASLDFSRFKPELILLEHYHIPKDEFQLLLEIISRHGYRCYSHGYDTLCFRQKTIIADFPLRIMKMFFPGVLSPVKNN